MHDSPNKDQLSVDQLRKMKYETSEVDVAKIMRLVGYMFVFIAIMLLITVGIYNIFLPVPKEAPMEAGDHVSHMAQGMPVLQGHPNLDMADFRKAEEDKTEAYGWVDDGKVKARVPVEVEIDKIVDAKALPKAVPGGITDPVQARKPADGVVAPKPSARVDVAPKP